MIDLPLIAQASKVVSEKLGLHFPENRYQDLYSGLTSAAKELGFEEGVMTFISLLIGQKISGKQLDILAEKLTIGETYFFREKHTLNAFRELIIPSLIRERQHTTRSIRIWSAGCCSGEEPYTLAMILSEIVPDIASWDISILATDINRRFLNKAITGKYTPWSFRETPASTKNRYFVPIGSEFQISQVIRNMVKFHPLNLAKDPFPLARNNTHFMDVIFCRNVLMYFTPETAMVVAEKFYRSLNDQGWFVTSQVELSDEVFHQLSKVNFKNSFLYRKTDKPAFTLRRQDIPEKRQPPAGIPSAKKRPPKRPEPSLTVKQPVASVQHPEQKAGNKENLLDLAKDYANQGELDKALHWSKKLIETEKSNPEVYYLHGTILRETGDLVQAEQVMKQVLYLDPDHLLAHFQMATLCAGNGKEKQSRKHKQNVNDLLMRYRDDDLIPGTEGMTAGHLRILLQPTNW